MALAMTATVACGAEIRQPAPGPKALGFEFINNAEFGKLWRERKVALLNTLPSKILEIEQKATPWDMVATDSADGSTVYVHVLVPPAGKSARLPAPKDGRKVTAATLLLGGGKVPIKQSDEQENHQSLQ